MTTRVERSLVTLALSGACGRAGKDYCDVLTSKGNKMSKKDFLITTCDVKIANST